MFTYRGCSGIVSYTQLMNIHSLVHAWGRRKKYNSRDVGNFAHISLIEHLLWGASEIEAGILLIPHMNNFCKLFSGSGLLHPGPDVLRHITIIQYIP